MSTAEIFNHDYWMREALALACKAESVGEVPVGAIVVYQDQIIGKGFNQPISGVRSPLRSKVNRAQPKPLGSGCFMRASIISFVWVI